MTTAFIKDDAITISEVQYTVGKLIDGRHLLENQRTGEVTTESAEVLLKKYVDGELLTSPERVHHADQRPPRPPLTLCTDATRAESRRRADYVSQLRAGGWLDGSREHLREGLGIIAATREELRPPHESTIYRWVRDFKKAREDLRALFTRIDGRGGRGLTRLEPEVEAIVHDKLETVFLSQKRSSAEDVVEAVSLEIAKLNASRTAKDQLRSPSLRTISRRIKALPAFDVALAKYGEKEAERRFTCGFRARRVSRILEIVEIDHSPVDLLVVDEHGKVVGRPSITVLLCRYSRCVLGYHLSLAGHGLPAVFDAIRHALFPKTYLSTRYGDLNLEWEMFGWFEKLLADNGSEFHADALRDALLNIAIAAEFAGAGEPNDKAHVERFLKTLNYYFIHRLPGTTLSKVHERVGFKAEDEACINMETLDRMIHVWICSHYHLRPHSGLGGRTPRDVWEESAAQFPPRLKVNSDDVDIEFSELTTSAVQHYGIDLNTYIYQSEELSMLRRLLPAKTKVTVKWPRNDAGHVWVWNPLERRYMKVWNIDEQYKGLTVVQAKAADALRRDGDPQYSQMAASASALVRDMAEASQEATKLAQRRRGARFANRTSNSSRHGPVDQAPTESLPALAGSTAPVLNDDDEILVEEV